MNIKEQENQLKFNLNLEIFLTIIVWILVVGFVGYRYYRLTREVEVPLTISNNVPTIKQENLELLRTSIKATTTSNLPVIRMEPFN